MFPKSDILKDKKYLKWVSTQPCLCCNTTQAVSPHHIETGGMGMKCGDDKTVPLCYAHHLAPLSGQKNESVHYLGREKFEERWGLDLQEKARELREKYLTKG